MKMLFLITALLGALGGYSQNFAIGHTTINFQDPERGNRQIETEIYYPATVSGNDTPALNGDFPVIVFGHGFVMAWSAYENLWNEFVPRGYIMAFPRTEGNILSTDHQEFGWDLEFLVTAMQQEGSDQNSILYDVVAPETALMGHSMGGGAAFLAADSLCNNGNQNLKTLIGLAPAESNSNGVSSIASATEITVPSFILSGVQDGVTPPADHHLPMYNNLASDCKTILNITGGAHCYFANSNFNCDFGEGTSSTGISISRQDQHDITFDFVNLWLDYSLKYDCNDFTVFNDSLNATPRATFDQVCSGPVTFESFESAEICQGATYTFPDGTTGSTATTYTSYLSSIGGCDSIIETTLSVQPSYQLAESIAICDGGTYTFPDGTTSSVSTVHTSGLASITGCDSIIETTLSVQPSYQLAESITICNGSTYTFPDGTTSSVSTVHTSALTSITGCDSIIETTLSVQPSYQLAESIAICNGSTYTFPDGTTSSVSTVHTSALTSITGCDSIIETTLSVQPSYQLAESAEVCNGSTYTFPDGTTSSVSTVHTSALTSITGCDSIIETTLDVVSSYNVTENISMCQGITYTFPDGTMGSTSMTYTSTLASVSGCDSIIETTLTVLPTYEISESATICEGDTYTFPDGTTGTSATVQTSNLTSSSGCDSIIETTLSVTTLNLGVTNNSGVLSADAAGATYQWMDCDNVAPISGETSQSFEPSVTGDYAVQITQDGCTDMSDCYEVQVSSIDEIDHTEPFKVYPNPSNGSITFNSDLLGQVEIFDVTGKLICSFQMENGSHAVLLKVESGIYTWKFESVNSRVLYGKLVIEKH